MLRRSVPVALFLCCGFFCPARASDESPTGLPVFAQEPSSNPQDANYWSGLSVGSEIFALSGKGAKGHAGGDGFVGYDHAFDNNLILGLRASAGYSPSLLAWGAPNGFDFTMTQVKLGYDAGQLKPYLTVGVGLAKANYAGPGGLPNAKNSFNNLFVGSGPKPLTSVGAGFDYAVTERLTVGVSVSATQGRGLGVLPPP